MTSDVKKTLREMKNNKAPGIDNLTNNVLILGEAESVKEITIFHKILETKKIRVEWNEAKMIILHKQETRGTLKMTGPSVYFPTRTNCSHTHNTKKNGKGSE